MKPKSRSGEDELPRGEQRRVAVVSARFYPELGDWLESGAREALDACGVAPESRVFARVPGCFELPLAIQRMVSAERLDAAVALGVIVRGETPHFEFVATECARGIMTVSLVTGVPVGFGVLTTDTLDQARERADPKRGNKGFAAVVAALSVASLGERAGSSNIGFRR